MSMKDIALPYGDSEIGIELPGGMAPAVAGGTLPPPLKDPERALEKVLAEPSGTERLGASLPGTGKVTVLVSDLTRGTAVGALLLHLLSLLEEAGAGPERVRVLLATGMHRGHSRDEMEKLLGASTVREYEVLQHDAKDPATCVETGKTSAGTPCSFNRAVVDSSLVIGLGMVGFHYFAGFGGGRKLILPGVASEGTILANHRLSLREDPAEGLAEGCMPGRLEGNPVHGDMLEGADTLDTPIFMVNVVRGAAGEPCFISAGDMRSSHLEAVEFLMERFTIPVERRYTAVIVSTGGYPSDMNLLQSHKALRNASYAVREGGLMLAAAECREGTGSDSLSNAFEEGRKGVVRRVEAEYTLNAQTAMSLLDLTARFSIYLRSSLGDGETARFGMQPWKDEYTGYLLEGMSPEEVLVIPHAASLLPVGG